MADFGRELVPFSTDEVTLTRSSDRALHNGGKLVAVSSGTRKTVSLPGRRRTGHCGGGSCESCSSTVRRVPLVTGRLAQDDVLYEYVFLVLIQRVHMGFQRTVNVTISETYAG